MEINSTQDTSSCNTTISPGSSIVLTRTFSALQSVLVKKV